MSSQGVLYVQSGESACSVGGGTYVQSGGICMFSQGGLYVQSGGSVCSVRGICMFSRVPMSQPLMHVHWPLSALQQHHV